jgi:hypothetical protein
MYLGVQQTYGGLSRVSYPLVAGLLSDQFGEGAPFWLSAVMVASTIWMGMGLGKYSRRSGEEEVRVVAEGVKKTETAVVE